MYRLEILIITIEKQMQCLHKEAEGTNSYISLMHRVEWLASGEYTGEDATWRTSLTEYCFTGLEELTVLCTPLPWKLWDLKPWPSSSLLERAPELWEPRPESPEDASEGISSHSMTTRLSTSLTDPNVPTEKPRLRFLSFDFFELSILKSSWKVSVQWLLRLHYSSKMVFSYLHGFL